MDLLSTVLNLAARTTGVDFSDAACAVAWSLLRSLRLGGGVAIPAEAHEELVAVGALYGAVSSKYLLEKSCLLQSKVCTLCLRVHRCPVVLQSMAAATACVFSESCSVVDCVCMCVC